MLKNCKLNLAAATERHSSCRVEKNCCDIAYWSRKIERNKKPIGSRQPLLPLPALQVFHGAPTGKAKDKPVDKAEMWLAEP